MATTEEIIGQTKDGRLIVYFEESGPSSYSSGGFSVSIGTLRKVERIVDLSNDGGFLTHPAKVTISGNSLTIPVYYHYFQCPVTCPVVGWEVTEGRDLSAYKFKGVVVGF